MNPFLTKDAPQRLNQYFNSQSGKIYSYFQRKIIDNWMQTIPRGQILDVGSGTGTWSEFIAIMGFDVLGIDISPEMIQHSTSQKNTFAHYQFSDASTYYLREPNQEIKNEKKSLYRKKILSNDSWKYTALTFFHSLEFLNNPMQILSNLIRFLQTNGNIFFLTMNGELSQSEYPQILSQFLDSAMCFNLQKLKEIFAQFGELTYEFSGFVTESEIEHLTIEEIINLEEKLKVERNRIGKFILGKARIN